MKYSPCREADSCSADRENPGLFSVMIIIFFVKNNMKLDPIMSQKNPILIFPNNITNIQVNIKFLYTHVFEEAISFKVFGLKCKQCYLFYGYVSCATRNL